MPVPEDFVEISSALREMPANNLTTPFGTPNTTLQAPRAQGAPARVSGQSPFCAGATGNRERRAEEPGCVATPFTGVFL